MTLILGMISDADEKIKNGAGKTVILQAICYAIFGKPLTKIKIPNMVNNINKKGMSAALDFEIGDTKYTIERGQKPAFLRFIVDGKEVKQDDKSSDALGENRFTQVEIERVFGMSHLMFKHILGLNTFTDPFLREREAVQREIIEELLALTQMATKAEQLSLLMKTTKDDIRPQEAHIKATTEANSRIETTLRQLETTERTWVRQKQNAIDRLRAEIEAIGGIDFDEALRQFDALESYDVQRRAIDDRLRPVVAQHEHTKRSVAALDREIARLLPAPTAASGARADREIDRRRKDIAAIATKVAASRSKIDGLRVDLENDDPICTCCGQHLEGTAHLAEVKANLQAQIDRHLTEIESNERLTEALGHEVATIEAEKVSAAAEQASQATEMASARLSLETERSAQVAALDEQAEEVARLKAEASAIGARPTVAFGSRDELYQVRSQLTVIERELDSELSTQNPYVDQIVTIKGTLQKIDYERLNELSTDLKHQDFLFKLLTSKDSFVRKKIIDQNLPMLNSRIAHYLQALALPHHVVFQSDLTVEITELGNDYDFEQLSRGEMNRVIMATAFAFRDVWENLNHPINLLWVDELLDQGTCSPGVEAALGILQEMGLKRGKNVFLVSHKDELQSRINETLMCVKTKRFTQFHAGAEVSN